jgi:hypothetical protein
VARKLTTTGPQSLNLQDFREDYRLEFQESPEMFLKHAPEHEKYEVLMKTRSLSPTDVIGPFKRMNYHKFMQVIKKPSKKLHLNFSKPFKTTSSPSLEERLTEREKIFRTSLDQKITEKNTAPYEKLLKQTKSLENYSKRTQYWERLEQNFADFLEKNPEDLRLNSGKAFIAKRMEMDVIEKFNKINEISEAGYWKNSLRNEMEEQKFFKKGSLELKNSLKLKKDFNKILMHSPRPENKNKLKNTQYFQEKLKKFEKFTEEVFGFAEDEDFFVKGVDKIKLEYDAAYRVGHNHVNLPPLEPYTDQIISKNYDSKVLYS